MLIDDAGSDWVISEVFPEKIFASIPITGISLLITPLLMGGLMSLWGVWKADHDYGASFMATFIGGALFGFAAAGARLMILN
ncbi:MAG: hypothetical protein CMO66_02825 [Verrucomicrobiales bacterium]|nr:hypothetical protein [Verrucomicrobiales bacterium]